MMSSRFRSEAAHRFAERRQREEEAPRLRDRVPSLASLRLDVTDRLGTTHAEPKYTRIVVVDVAPALFVLTCADRSCRDGGHDVTDAVLKGLLAGSTSFELEHECSGDLGSTRCARSAHVTVSATYR
ncbi:MAG: hypothetical protein ACRELB_12700 [Polyangiaceae bacterium]